uniref:Uncharacterized protein n=1 Tax=Macrostomum lignano TaxID=282301 RepID=A0A1I8FDH7_9PLAT
MAAEQDLLKSSARALQDKGPGIAQDLFSFLKRPECTAVEFWNLRLIKSPKDLPSHSIAPGDIVANFPFPTGTATDWFWYFTKVLARAVCVAMETDQASSAASSGDGQLEVGYKYSVVKLGSDVTFKRLKKKAALTCRPAAWRERVAGTNTRSAATFWRRVNGSSSGSSRGVSYFNPHLTNPSAPLLNWACVEAI